MLFSGVRVGPSPISGDGLFADTSFKRGGLITVYQGEVCTEERGAEAVEPGVVQAHHFDEHHERQKQSGSEGPFNRPPRRARPAI